MKANLVKQVLLGATAQDVPTVSVAASATASPVSKIFPASYLDALNGVLDISVSDVTVTTAVSVILQDSMDCVTWNDVITASVSATGSTEMRWNVQTTADQAFLPLRPNLRVVATTGSGDALTLDSILFATKG